MKQIRLLVFNVLLSLYCAISCLATDHFVSPSGGNLAPFTSWDTAATNIQDAIDAAVAGETVWVTNGLYATGGKVMAGDLTNRVALDKALTVQSVNGPYLTIIQGAWDPATIVGPLAIRCAWLTNAAALRGFTLTGGATRTTNPANDLRSGGGVWCASSSSLVANCVIRSNVAHFLGGGTYRGRLENCLLIANGMPDRTYSGAAACSNAVLVNCTVVSNAPGVAISTAVLTNCIVYGNTNGNYVNATFFHCCTTPLPPGSGNFSADPQLVGDGSHLASSSPCKAAGSSPAFGTDLDSQPWGTPPSIGCDEWYPAPTPWGQPVLQATNDPVGFSFTAWVAGQEPFVCWWSRDGVPLEDDGHYSSTHTTNLVAAGLRPYDGGNYQVVVSNAFGTATSLPVRLPVHCVDAASANPIPPFLDWSTAATNIQDAVDAAAAGEFVLVTNGLYSSGGRAMAGDLTNRVALSKPITVASINGAASTVIQGAWDPISTNGLLAIRCLWLTNGAAVVGFTIQNGATRNSGDGFTLQSGGGAWCASTNKSLLSSCVLSNNTAAGYGGGSYQGRIQRSILWGNAAPYGGGAYAGSLASSLVRSNTASQFGGGLMSGTLTNCTVIANLSPYQSGGGEFSSKAWNSIIFYNLSLAPGPFFQNYYNDWDITAGRSGLVSCWTTTSSDPVYNSTASPQFTLDGFHLAATSPCRAAGNLLYSSGTDLDGEPWLSPPSIGCDEYIAADFTGPLTLGPIVAYNFSGSGPPLSRVLSRLSTTLTGNPDRVSWSFGDGASLTNVFTFTPSHTWTNPGDYSVTFTAFNADYPAGVSTNALIHVLAPDSPLISNPTFTGTNFVLSFPVQLGVHYVVEQTTNLAPPVAWQTVYSFLASQGTPNPFVLTDNNATNSLLRFYRVRIQ